MKSRSTCTDSTKFILKVKNFLPGRRFFYFFFILIKFLPMFIISHDWQLKTKGISNLLSNFSMGLFIYKLDNIILNQAVTCVYNVLMVISILIVVISYKKFQNNQKLFQKEKYFLNLFTQILFYLCFISQYFYVFAVENIFCGQEKNDNSLIEEITYSTFCAYCSACSSSSLYFFLTQQIITIILILIISYFVTILIFQPMHISNNTLATKLNVSNYEWVLFPLVQIGTQLELHLPWEYSFPIKVTIRVFYLIYFMYAVIFNHGRNTYSGKKATYFVNLLQTMCFVSILIEFCFMFDYKNKLMILQNELMIIILKFLIEFFISLFIMKCLSNREKRYIKYIGTSDKISSSSAKNENIDKFFYLLSITDPEIDPDTLTLIITKFNQNLQTHIEENKCLLDESYCVKYPIEEVYRQTNQFFQHLKHVRLNSVITDEFLLKEKLPVIYDYIKQYIELSVDNYTGHLTSNYSQNILIALVFSLNIERNFTKTLFYLEHFKQTNLYKKSFVIKLQLVLVLDKIKSEYLRFNKLARLRNINGSNDTLKNQLEKNSILKNEEMMKNYKLMKKMIFVEDSIKTTFSVYLEIIAKLQENSMTFNNFSLIMKNFYDQILITNEKIKILERKLNFIFPFLGCKMYLYYRFFYLQDENTNSNLYKYFSKIEKIVIDENNFFANNLDFDPHICASFVILKIQKLDQNDNIMTIPMIDYCSYLIYEDLGYNFLEMKKFEFQDLLPKSMRTHFLKELTRSIKEGTHIKFKELCLTCKDSCSKLFNFEGIVVIHHDQIKIFGSMKQVKYLKKKKAKKISKTFHNPNKSQHSDLIEAKSACFIYAKESGKIISISKEFENIFHLPLTTVTKIKLNIFTDFLKIENFNKKKMKFAIKLETIYKNIADLNFDAVYESSNEDFRKIQKQILNLRKLAKINQNNLVKIKLEEKYFNKSKNDPPSHKPFYFIKFSHVNSECISSINLSKYKSQMANAKGAQSGATKSSNIYKSPRTNSNEYHISFINKENILQLVSKLEDVREISFKQLKHLHSIEKKDLVNSIEDLKEKKKNKSIFNNINNHSESNTEIGKLPDLHKYKMNRRVTSKISTLTIIMITFLLLIIVYMVLILVHKESIYDKGYLFLTNHYHLHLTQNVLFGIIGTIVQMEIHSNKLQPDFIDNGFRNDFEFHISNLNNRISDYINYYNLFRTSYLSLDADSKEKLNEILFRSLPYEKLNLNLTKENVDSNLWDSLYYFHLTASKILYKSEISGENESFTASQYLLDNSFTNIAEPLEEVIEKCLNLIEEHSSESTTRLLSFYFTLLPLLLLMFIYQPFVFNKINKIIFSKFYMNFNYLRFFNDYLQNKASVLNMFIQNCNSVNMKPLRGSQLFFMDDYSELEFYKKEINKENASTYMIRLFPVKLDSSGNYSNLCNLKEVSSPEGFSINLQSESVPNDNQKDFVTFSDFKNLKNIIKEEIGEDSNQSQIKNITPISSPEHHLQSKYKKIKDNINQNTTTNQSVANTNQSHYQNTTHNNLLSSFENNNRKSLLSMPSSFKKYSLMFFVSFLFILILVTADYLIFVESVKLNINIAKGVKLILERVSLMKKLIYIYELSILNSKIYKYFDKDIFESNSEKFTYFTSGMTDLVNDKDFLTFTSDLEIVFNTDKFCEEYSNFSNRSDVDIMIPYLKEWKNVTQQGLLEVCNQIGKGFNSKGLSTAMNSMYTGIVSQYKEFKEKYLNEPMYTSNTFKFNKLNDPFIQTYQVEMDRLFYKFYINYIFTLNSDYLVTINNNNQLKHIFISLIIVLIAFLIVYYIMFFSRKFLLENSLMDHLDNLIISNLFF